MIRRILPALVVAFAVSACTQQSTPTAPTTTSDSQVVAEAKPCPEVPLGYQPFPAGVTPTLKYHLRNDRIYAHANGTQRRRLTLEALEGDVASAQASLADALEKGGFRAKPAKTRSDGGTQIAFTKSGLGTLYMVIKPMDPAKTSHPYAKGEISIDYPVDLGSPPFAGA